MASIEKGALAIAELRDDEESLEAFLDKYPESHEYGNLRAEAVAAYRCGPG